MKKNTNKIANDLIKFIDNSPTAFHATEQIKQKLIANNYTQLHEEDKWTLQPQHKYFLERNNSSIVAFITGTQPPAETGFKIIGAHTDSPALKIKPDSETWQKNTLKIFVEIYGGPIITTWLDRPLGIAGRVMIKNNNKYSSKLINLKNILAIIPNLAIHLNKEANKGFQYNTQNHLPAIIALENDTNKQNITIKTLIAKQLKINKEQISEYDLFLYDAQPGILCGANKQLINTSRLDDLAMCHASLTALQTINQPQSTILTFFFDNEEIGSTSAHGANSGFAKTILQRITAQTSTHTDDYFRAIAKSFLISADCAHAYHPNFADKQDPNYSPLINQGPAVKINANQRYSTTAQSAATFIELCQQCQVPVQKLLNRTDIPCGSTIGPMSAAHLEIKSVDVGNPMLAMHSIRETAGIIDHIYMIKIFEKFLQQ